MGKRETILAVLAATHVPLTLHSVMREVEAGPEPCRRHLHALMAAGLVVRSGLGRVGRPYFYARPGWCTRRGQVVPTDYQGPHIRALAGAASPAPKAGDE